MNNDLSILTLSAASLGFVHTVLGPDHYLPFIVMSRARNWPVLKTAWVTLICGIGHVGSSIAIGVIGLSVGYGLSHLDVIEGLRGNLAAWLLVLFGAGYLALAFYRLSSRKPHKHVHMHDNGTYHVHEHTHANAHDHVHNKRLTPWLLFIIFVLGPCESLIPVLMYPAAGNSTWGIVQVALVFSVVTVLTMLAIVIMASYGLKFVRLGNLERYVHVIAGATIMLSGMAILFLGL